MYLYFTENGKLVEIINDEISRQGDSSKDKLYIFWEGMKISTIQEAWSTFKLIPNGNPTTETVQSVYENKTIPYDPERDLKYFEDYTKYNFLVVTVPDEVLTVSGTWGATIRFVKAGGSANVLGLIPFIVETSVILEDKQISQSQYNYLLDYVDQHIVNLVHHDIALDPNNLVYATSSNSVATTDFSKDELFKSSDLKSLNFDKVKSATFDSANSTAKITYDSADLTVAGKPLVSLGDSTISLPIQATSGLKIDSNAGKIQVGIDMTDAVEDDVLFMGTSGPVWGSIPAYSLPVVEIVVDDFKEFAVSLTDGDKRVLNSNNQVELILRNNDAVRYRSIIQKLDVGVTAQSAPIWWGLYSADQNSFVLNVQYNEINLIGKSLDIKTVNGNSVLGSGNIAVQPTLVSGSNIKTINGNSILGNGDVQLQSTIPVLNLTVTDPTQDFESALGSTGQNYFSDINCLLLNINLNYTSTSVSGIYKSFIQRANETEWYGFLNNGDYCVILKITFDKENKKIYGKLLNIGNKLTTNGNLIELSNKDNPDYIMSFAETKKINNTSVLGSGNIDISKISLGLGNVDNTSDVNKPISTATQTALDAKQKNLVSGTDIKTINRDSILGAGDMMLQPTLNSGVNIKTVNKTSVLGSGNIAVQPTLTSGSNIKTINGNSILGSGDITISGGSKIPNISFNVTDLAKFTVAITQEQHDILDANTIVNITINTGYHCTISKALNVNDDNVLFYGITDDTVNPVVLQILFTKSNMNISGSTLNIGNELRISDKKIILANSTTAGSGISEIETKTVNNTSVLGSGNIDISKTSLGLGNVDNTSDVNKPISTATQTALDAKQKNLVSGTDIKTINRNSILGSGNIAVQPTLISGSNIKTINGNSVLGSGNIAVQPTLTSGSNIKTINGNSILGSGNITISSSQQLYRHNIKITRQTQYGYNYAYFSFFSNQESPYTDQDFFQQSDTENCAINVPIYYENDNHQVKIGFISKVVQSSPYAIQIMIPTATSATMEVLLNSEISKWEDSAFIPYSL